MNNILITGASKGIGAAIGKEWCKRDKEAFYYSISKFSNLDVKDYKCVCEFLDGIMDENFPEALINNASIVKTGTILELDPDSWKKQIETNLNGVFNCSKAYAKYCIKYGIEGKIINIASTAGLGARPGRSAYAASKAGVINFSLSLAEELKEYNIKVYCVCPGAVNTNMRKKINPDDDFENMLQPQDVASFVCDLIKDGKYLDNQVLKIIGKG